MQALARGDLAPTDPALITHLDRCLGCRACEPVCPSGVSYGPALEESRWLIAQERGAPRSVRLVTRVLAEPAFRIPALALARAVRPVAWRLAGGSRFGFLAGMLAATKADWRTGGPADRRTTGPLDGPTARPPHRSTAVVFRGCIMEGLFDHVHAATERTLGHNGYQLGTAPDQGCCGALHTHAGLHREALALARANVLAFAAVPEARIVVNSAGCGAMLEDYARLLADDPLADQAARLSERVVDVTEALALAGPRPGARIDATVAYDPPCHLLHVQRVADAPLRVLEAVPGLKRVHHAEADLCCGSAGSYSLTEPMLSRAVLARKVEALSRVRPDLVATGNPGCIMQIGAGLRAAGLAIPVVHPAEILDRSYALAGHYDAA
jgi:glycolate oxidase iron-sulfur subunit